MPVSAETLRVLMSKGLAGEDLLEVVSAIDADHARETPSVDTAAEKRRAYDRARKAAKRSGGIPVDNSGGNEGGTNTGNSGNSGGKSGGIPPEQKSPSLCREKKKKERGASSEIPSDWKPSETDRAYARSKGLTEAQIDREAERMLNHFIASRKRWSDWAAVWRNWILKAAEFLGCKPVEAAPVAAVPKFETEEEFNAWWAARHAAGGAA